MPIIKILSGLLLLAITSCNKQLSGKIEERENKSVYLVNKSKSKPFKFTIKKSALVKDSVIESETSLISLFPGEEKYLGDSEAVSDSDYVPVLRKELVLTGADKDPLGILVPPSLANNLKDTIIDKKDYKYAYIDRETLVATAGMPIRFEYEVTGQVGLKH